jgi:hypothetical protein
MRIYKMPMNATLDMLSECCHILHEYRESGCPGFPESNDYVDRLMAIGVTREEAVEQLAITLDN